MSYTGKSMASAASGFGVFVEDPTRGCGTDKPDIKIAQAALNSLGYKDYENKLLIVDGDWGGRSKSSWMKYYLAKLAQGKPAANCKDLLEDAATAAKNKSTGAGDCPDGMVRWMDVCVPDLFKQQQPKKPDGQPAQPAPCKEGEVGVPGFCIPASVLPVKPSNVSCPAGFVFAGGACVPEGGSGLKPGAPPEPEKGMSTNAKIALGIGGLAAVGILVAALTIPKKRPSRAMPMTVPMPMRATPNKRRKIGAKAIKSKKNFVAKAASKAAKAKPRRGPGKIITIGKGKKARRWGHTIAPKKHREKGATKQSQYAWSQGFKYPIYDARHARAAQAYFARFKKDLPMSVRREIAKNINDAKKRYGIGGQSVKPNRRRG